MQNKMKKISFRSVKKGDRATKRHQSRKEYYVHTYLWIILKRMQLFQLTQC